MGSLWQDVRYAGRMLRKTPGFTAIALITLAIGIGANTIMFGVVNVLLFRPVLVRDPGRLTGCGIRDGWCSYPVYADLRDSNPAFSNLMAHGNNLRPVTLVQGNVARRVTSMFVSANYFSLLGVAPARGRGFLPEEERKGAEPAAVLSYRTWQRQGADPDIVGMQVAINGTLFRIVGVAPRGFTGTTVLGPDLWLPLGSFGLVGREGVEKPAQVQDDLWDYGVLSLVGRLRPGLDPATAQTQLQSLAARLKESYPRQWLESSTLDLHRLPRLAIDTDENDRRVLSGVSLFLMGVSAVVLLIACLNLANMMVVQGTARQREIAIRLAVGGGRLRILRQLLFESLLLALLGGTGGLLLAFWGNRILNAWVAGPQLEIDLAGSFRMGLDLRVLGATLGFCLVATMLFGLKPALRLSRRDILADIKEAHGETQRSVWKKRRFLPHGLSVVGQIALSVVLVLEATLFTRSALHAARVSPGFDLGGKLLVQIDPLAAGYDRARSMQVYEALLTHLGTLPGVQAVALSTSFPFDEGGDHGTFIAAYVPGVENKESEEPPQRRPAPKYVAHYVRGDFFESLGIPLLQGRCFEQLDSTPGAEKVVIINEGLARKLRPEGSALGRLVQYGSRAFSSMSAPCRVVGIVPDVQTGVQDRADFPQLYLPLASDRLPAFIHVRVARSQSETALLRRVAAEIHAVEPQLPIVSVTTLAENYHDSAPVWGARLGARLALTFGAMALFLASLGIYAVKGYAVASRTAEIGIRKALGATHGKIMNMILREGLLLTFAGLAVGLFLGLAVARLLASLFYGVRPVDPVSIVATVALLGVASLLAGYLPARRAARIDPMAALRCE